MSHYPTTRTSARSGEVPKTARRSVDRAGLCDLLAKKIIDLDFAIDLFNGEHAHGIQKRIEEEQTSQKEIGA